MIKIPLDLQIYKSILCLDGDIPCDFIRNCKLPIIAADGAANTLVNNGIEPYIIVGDLDSVDKKILAARKHKKNPSQYSTDFEKSLQFAEENNLSPCIITGINGGYIDHIIGNIGIFSRTNSIAICDETIGLIVRSKESFHIPVDTKISTFGFPKCIVSSRGMKWEMKDYELSINGATSYGNRAAQEDVELIISSGTAIVFVHMKDIVDAGSVSHGF